MAAGVLASVVIGAEPRAAAQSADDYLRICLSDGDKLDLCEKAGKRFTAEYSRALKGDYQAQRNVGYCLSRDCGEPINQNPPAGCAWRIIILASGSTKVGAGDVSNFEYECGKLSKIDLATASAQAQAIFPKIYKRPLPDMFR